MNSSQSSPKALDVLFEMAADTVGQAAFDIVQLTKPIL